MKKVIPLFLSAIMILTLSACGGKGKSVSFAPKTNSPFSMSAEIKNGDTQASAVITRYGADNWDAEFSAPNTLAGVLISYRDNNVEASYKGLSFSVPKSALPLKAMISNLIEAVDGMSNLTEISCEEDDGIMVYEGENEQGKYTMKFNNDGSLCGFDMPAFELEMIFTDFSENVSPSQNEGSTETATEADESVAETQQSAETQEAE
ncbi:MAG: lipoprotein [Porcipelethomonas sp.]